MGNNNWLFEKPYEPTKCIAIEQTEVESDLWQQLQALTFLQGVESRTGEFHMKVCEILLAMARDKNMKHKAMLLGLISKQKRFLNELVHSVYTVDNSKPVEAVSLPCHIGRWGLKW